MKLHGSLEDNLSAAVRSAHRLRGHPVHSDTLQYWRDLLHHARRETAAKPTDDHHVTNKLMAALESELAER
jgi:hypothetical protein